MQYAETKKSLYIVHKKINQNLKKHPQHFFLSQKISEKNSVKFYQFKLIGQYDQRDLDTEKTSIMIFVLFFDITFTQEIVFTQ